MTTAPISGAAAAGAFGSNCEGAATRSPLGLRFVDGQFTDGRAALRRGRRLPLGIVDYVFGDLSSGCPVCLEQLA